MVGRKQPVSAMLAIACTLTMVCGTARAQWQPTQPITFIVMAGKGGGADKAVRFLVKTMMERKLVSVPFEVINLKEGSGAQAMSELQRRAGNNHTLMFTLNSYYTTPLRRPDLKIDIAKFTPIARMAEDAFVLWVHSDRKDINTVGEFVKAAKAKGRAWVMSGTGKGAEDNLLTDFLNATYGLRMTYRPLKGGGAVAKQLIARQADSTVNNPSEQNQYFAKGLSKPIFVFTQRRLPAYARAPALRETGMDFHYLMQRSVVGPARMAPPAVAYYQNLFRSLFDSAEWQQYRARNSLQGAFLTGADLRAYWVKEREKHLRWTMAIEIMKPQ